MKRFVDILYEAVFWVLVCIAIAALFAAAGAHADSVARSDNGARIVRLTSEPCPLSVLARLPEGTRGYYRRAYSRIDGQDFVACWALRADQYVYLQYEDGDAGLVEWSAFKPAVSI